MRKTTVVDGKHMRLGFTTGTCVVAAAKAAIEALEKRETIHLVEVRVPAGDVLAIDVYEHLRSDSTATYSVIKDSGDDPDITNGMEIFVTIKKTNTGDVVWERGVGVGTFTEDGLMGKAGELAVNPVPRREIEKLLRAHMDKGIAIKIDIPEGEELAKKTFNPRLGIVGGLSILGTSGLVVPMSKSAYVATIDLELKKLRKSGADAVILTPGNYGEERAEALGLHAPVVKVSNYFGDALCLARDLGFREITLMGHVGKMAKVSIGIYQTHSAVADGRMEAIAYYMAKAGAGMAEMDAVEAEKTADQAIKKAAALGYETIMEAMERGIEKRVPLYLKTEDIKIRAMIYTM